MVGRLLQNARIIYIHSQQNTFVFKASLYIQQLYTYQLQRAVFIQLQGNDVVVNFKGYIHSKNIYLFTKNIYSFKEIIYSFKELY